MTRCAYCGVQNELSVGPCIFCGRRIAEPVSDVALRKVGITILVPLLIWICAHRGLGI
jgi:hypothetical protein